MMALTQHPLVTDYLARLRTAASRLPAADAASLVADIEEHLAAAEASGITTEAEIRTLLDRLGRPEDLVEEIAPPPPVGTGPASRERRFEGPTAALFFVAEALAVTVIGAPVGLIAWVAAWVLLAMGTRWDTASKTRAGLVLGSGLPVMLLGVIGGGLATFRTETASQVCRVLPDGSQECSGGGVEAGTSFPWGLAITIALLAGYLALQVITARRLLRAASATTDA
ncbi:MAG: hypothetical protein V9G19_15790 [Tetrasphaera sp.]